MTLPTPVFAAAAAACLLAGFLVGAVTSPGGPDPTTAKVQSYAPGRAELCLTGEAVDAWEGMKSAEGTLCGTWRRTPGSRVPDKGDTFRFVAVQTKGESAGETKRSTVIYGDVVG